MICPDCQGELTVSSPVMAKCAVHGGIYRVLFQRPPAMSLAGTPRPAADPAAGCARHPEVPAAFCCQRCGTPTCATCAFSQPDGDVLCPDCASGRMLGIVTRPAAAALASLRCPRHPEIPAVERCANCQSPVCGTCDFAFEGGLHFCPACATGSSSQAVSGKRKGQVFLSYGLALFATLSFFGLMIAAASTSSKKDSEALGALLGVLTLIPTVIGVGVGIGSIDRRLINPWWVWGAAVWNGMILAGMILLMVVGAVSG
jgi:B-box zinc finger protein